MIPLTGLSTPSKKGTLMSQTTPSSAGPLTVVLVHGAFADASSWTGVIERLQKEGVQVTAPANPLRGLSIDSAYIASVFDQIPGPVLAVGHSYGGAVITKAATKARNVVGLVYVAAFAPDEGERLSDAESTSKDSVLSTALVPLQYPTGQGAETAVEFAVNLAHFHDAFAADLPAWKTLPAWAVVATGDKAAGSDVIRSMAQRAGATITEVEGSHVIMISQPQAVTDVILRAVAAVG